MIQCNTFLDSGWYLCVYAKCNLLYFFFFFYHDQRSRLFLACFHRPTCLFVWRDLATLSKWRLRHSRFKLISGCLPGKCWKCSIYESSLRTTPQLLCILFKSTLVLSHVKMDKVVFCSISSAPWRAVTQRHFLSDARGFIKDLQNFLHSEGKKTNYQVSHS